MNTVKIYIATLIIVNPRNELYSVILTGTSPDEIFRQLQMKAETEAKKGVKLQFDEALQDEDAYKDDSPVSGPVAAENTEDQYFLITKVETFSIETKEKTYGIFDPNGVLLQEFGTFKSFANAGNVLRKAQLGNPYKNCRVKEID